MLYLVTILPQALQQLGKIPKRDQKRIAQKIDALASQPRPAGIKKLESPNDLYRIRVGNYRIIYQIHDDVLKVLVVKIDHRRQVYRGL